MSRDREPLWRDVLGEHLRSLRHARGETLADTARRAGVSPQYLSEVERGVKEPSSEMIAAMAGALDTSLVDLTTGVAERLRTARFARSGAGRDSVRAKLVNGSARAGLVQGSARAGLVRGSARSGQRPARPGDATAMVHAGRPLARRRRPYPFGRCRSSITWSMSPYSRAASAVKTRSWSVSARSRSISWLVCRDSIRSMSARTRTTSSA